MFQWLDSSLFSVLNRGAANPALDWLMPRLTNLHQTWPFWVAVLLLSVVVLSGSSKRAKIWLLSAFVAVGISDLAATKVMKRIVERDRPCQVSGSGTVFADDRMVPGTHCPGSRSFPSNHASNMMALGAVCWWFTRRRWARWLWFLIPLVIGYSRIYLGFHYPSDVFGGWILGALIASVVIAASRQWLMAGPPTSQEKADGVESEDEPLRRPHGH